MISFRRKGNFSKLSKHFERLKEVVHMGNLDRYGKAGVDALSAATPKDTGKTASSWYYQIIRTKNSVSITFNNSNIQNGVPIAIILQYGHATNGGYWVEGIDYINPTIKPIFEKIANDAWEEVTKV